MNLKKSLFFSIIFQENRCGYKTFCAFALSEWWKAVKKLKNLIVWFIRLVRKDEAEYKVDREIKQRIYRSVRKQEDKEKKV